jgi:hypothetical protein
MTIFQKHVTKTYNDTFDFQKHVTKTYNDTFDFSKTRDKNTFDF